MTHDAVEATDCQPCKTSVAANHLAELVGQASYSMKFLSARAFGCTTGTPLFVPRTPAGSRWPSPRSDSSTYRYSRIDGRLALNFAFGCSTSPASRACRGPCRRVTCACHTCLGNALEPRALRGEVVWHGVVHDIPLHRAALVVPAGLLSELRSRIGIRWTLVHLHGLVGVGGLARPAAINRIVIPYARLLIHAAQC